MRNYDPVAIEKEILTFWDKNNIYSKQKKKGKPFYFLQGPPYTSGRMHLGQAWNNSMKDMVLRYKRMNGFDVYDRAGWDMHGLPTALKVQKRLKLKGKDAVEKYGVAKFTKECEKHALEMMHHMEKDFVRLGVWMDLENAYKPIDADFMEGVWWCIKQADKNGYLYKGKKVMTWCSSCGTALAKHELEYETDTDESIYLKFPIKNKKNKFLVIWTTTPWTIPFNLAVMVNPELEYVDVEVGNEVWIMAKGLAGIVLGTIGKKYKILKTYLGDKLEGLEYSSPFENQIPYLNELKKKYKWMYKVLLSEKYVDLSGGSGLVHCAPGCGPEDYEVGKAHNLPPFNELLEDGSFSSKMGKFVGWTAKVDDEKFIKELRKTGMLVHTSDVEHEYAHCWRCKKPVVFRATEQWFFAVEKLRTKMQRLNKKVRWVPEWAGSQAFNNWLVNLRDIGITRQRYWGTPVPIWVCNKCKKYKVVGSVKELAKLATSKIPSNIHIPHIDKVKLKCVCGGAMTRIPDIADVWLDAGCASWISLYFPQKKNLMKKFYAPDFILEGKDQIRGWFNLLLDAAMVSGLEHPYKAVYMHGFIQDYRGTKMSKSLGNITRPSEIIDVFGADTLRFYTIGAAKPGEDLMYVPADAKTKYRSLGILWNTASYLIRYAAALKVDPTKKAKLNESDKYMLSRVNSTIKRVTELFDSYYLEQIPQQVEDLFLELSRWYIKTARERVNDSPEAVLYVLFNSLLTSLKMLAPIAPFVSEACYLNLKKAFRLREESIHLFDWPKAGKSDLELEKDMKIVQDVVSAILASRDQLNRGIRWPVKGAEVLTKKPAIKAAVKRHIDLIKQLANVGTIKIVSTVKGMKYNIKPNFAKLGPKLGQRIAIFAANLAKLDHSKLMTEIEKKGKITVKGLSATRLELVVSEELPTGLVSGQGAGFSVYVSEEETASMLVSGFARELTRKIQDMRKSAGLSKGDKIVLTVAAPIDLKSELNNIKKRVGASSIKLSTIVGKHKGKLLVRKKEFKIGFDS